MRFPGSRATRSRRRSCFLLAGALDHAQDNAPWSAFRVCSLPTMCWRFAADPGPSGRSFALQLSGVSGRRAFSQVCNLLRSGWLQRRTAGSGHGCLDQGAADAQDGFGQFRASAILLPTIGAPHGERLPRSVDLHYQLSADGPEAGQSYSWRTHASRAG